MGGHSVIPLTQLGGLQGYAQGIAVGGQYGQLDQLLNQGMYPPQPKSTPDGWEFTDFNAGPVPVTFLAKLRNEIKEWHGNPLERTSPT